MDVGDNEALYDLLPIMMFFCRKHVHLVTLSVEDDIPKFNLMTYHHLSNALVVAIKQKSTQNEESLCHNKSL